MDTTLFKTQLAVFCDNYSFQVSEGYIKLVYGALNNINVTDEQFKSCIQNCIYKKKRSDFYAMPAVADWLDMLGKLDTETIADKRVKELWKFLNGQCYWSAHGELVKDFAEYEYDFKDSYINDFIETEYNSIGNITSEYITAFKKGEHKWLKKEITEKMNKHSGANNMLVESDNHKQIT